MINVCFLVISCEFFKCEELGSFLCSLKVLCKREIVNESERDVREIDEHGGEEFF